MGGREDSTWQPWRATALIGASSLGSMAIGVASAKVWAVSVGPAGYGRAAVLQAVVGIGAIVAGYGLGTGIVRVGSSVLARGDQPEFMALVRAGWWLLGRVTLASCVALTAVASLLDDVVGVPALDLVLMSGVIALVAASTYQDGVVNAHHRVAALAANGVAASALGAAVALPLIGWGGMQAVLPAVVVVQAAAWAVSYRCYRSVLGARLADPERSAFHRRALIRLGGPIAASGLVGTGVTAAVPLVISGVSEQIDAVGLYRAAATIAITQFGVLFAVLGKDFYPRLASVRDDPAAIRKVFAQQFAFSMLTGSAAALVMLIASGFIVPILFSLKFRASVPLLDWMLVGNIFKLAAWCLSYVTTTRSSTTVLFSTECAFGGMLLLSSWIGLRTFGLVGVGVGFALTHAAYLVLIAVVAGREIPGLFGVRKVGLVGALAAAAVALCWYKSL